VYLNGVLLNGTDYTASNGTSVVLAVAASAGDIVETIAYYTVNVAPTGPTGPVSAVAGPTGPTGAASSVVGPTGPTGAQGNAGPTGAALNATYTRTSFTATAGQTTFTVAYTVGFVEVYLNGVFLNGTDYTASNGTSVVLGVAAVAGDIVETVAFYTVNVAPTGPTGAASNVAGPTGPTGPAQVGGITTGKAIAMAIVFGG
jgi:hypothetical protein